MVASVIRTLLEVDFSLEHAYACENDVMKQDDLMRGAE